VKAKNIVLRKVEHVSCAMQARTEKKVGAAPQASQQGPQVQRPPPQSRAGTAGPPAAAQVTSQVPARSQMTHPSVIVTRQLEMSLHVTRHPCRQSTSHALVRPQFTSQSSPHVRAQLEASWQANVQ
jgi:hypothetical protein